MSYREREVIKTRGLKWHFSRGPEESTKKSTRNYNFDWVNQPYKNNGKDILNYCRYFNPRLKFN